MAQKPVPGGMIDPITHYVVNCFGDVLEGRHTLEQIFKECPIVGDKEGTSSSLSIHISRIMEVLEINLEAKSKNYTDPALCAVFMINNWNYVVLKVIISEMATILGHDWIIKHTTKVHQNLEHYQRTWDKVLELLMLDSNEREMLNVVEDSMKEKLELFNKRVNDMFSVQSTWFILDGQLREKIRISVEKNLLPALENFTARFQKLIGKDAYEYAMFDTDALLNNLFRGNKIGNLLMGM
ncbi:putative exocyst complex component Exo70, cullin repeat-like-containing domain-containing protein [Lupinus albus]|uniref:Exocyst subunit Exo70 family protein n=1 Tax=Lupinus albus TaxID=3870 RepID=A0A6A4PX65_LUPAL|nr:putative exocyst complex component Exo70, cullin repeat-like-containing domain-containing protein [Lupinus albus]